MSNEWMKILALSAAAAGTVACAEPKSHDSYPMAVAYGLALDGSGAPREAFSVAFQLAAPGCDGSVVTSDPVVATNTHGRYRLVAVDMMHGRGCPRLVFRAAGAADSLVVARPPLPFSEGARMDSARIDVAF